MTSPKTTLGHSEMEVICHQPKLVCGTQGLINGSFLPRQQLKAISRPQTVGKRCAFQDRAKAGKSDAVAISPVSITQGFAQVMIL